MFQFVISHINNHNLNGLEHRYTTIYTVYPLTLNLTPYCPNLL